MEMSVSPRQVLFLWNILFAGQEPRLSDAVPKLRPDERRPLEEAGWIRLEKRGRSRHVVPTETAWAWAVAHLDAEIPARSPAASPVLRALLRQVKAFAETRHVSLTDILRPKPRGEVVPTAAASSRVLENLEQLIRKAYLTASGSAWGVWVKLAELRRLLPKIPRPALDKELLRLQKDKQAVLYPIDNPQSIKPEDRDAAIDVLGFKRHIVLMKGEAA